MKIYDGQPFTKTMVLSIVDDLESWEQLEQALIAIDYPYDFKNDNGRNKKKSKWKFWK